MKEMEKTMGGRIKTKIVYKVKCFVPFAIFDGHTRKFLFEKYSAFGLL